MALHVKFKPPDFSALLNTAGRAKSEIDDIAAEALSEAVKPIQDDMLAGAMPHKKKGRVVDALKNNPLKVNQQGNKLSVDVGIVGDDAKTAWHAVFQEYGAPRFKADPFIRPAIEKGKAKYKKIVLEVFARRGVPLK